MRVSMRDAGLVFDRTKHLLYSRRAKRVIRDYLRRAYPQDRTETLWEETQRIYVRFLETLPGWVERKICRLEVSMTASPSLSAMRPCRTSPHRSSSRR